MRVDAYCHFASLSLLDFLEHESGQAHVFRRLFQNTPTLHDPEQRLRLMDEHAIETSLIVPLPWIENVPGVSDDARLTAQAARIANDEIAALASRHPGRFRGIALLPCVDEAGLLAEAERALSQLDVAGFALFVGPTVPPIDDPRFEGLFAMAARVGAPIWLHPCRPHTYPDYVGEPGSQHLIWQTLGWLFDTSAAMVRMVFGGAFERHPELRVVVHHHGALVPLFAKRMQTSYDYFEQNTGAQFGAAIPRPYIDSFRKFYCDTATFGFEPLLLEMAVEFFGIDHVLFGTDTPMDAASGAIMAGESIRSIEALELSPEDRHRVFRGNAERLLERRSEPNPARDR